MTEASVRTILIGLNYLGWGLSVLLGVAYWNQRKEINKLRSNIAILKSHEDVLRRKDVARDELIMEMIRILRDQNITIDNRKRLDEALGKYEKQKLEPKDND